MGRKAFFANDAGILKRQLKEISSKCDLKDTFTQELIPFDVRHKTISFTAFCIEGTIKTYWMGVKLREHPLRFGTATMAESVFVEECLVRSKSLLDALKYTGVCEVEYLFDSNEFSTKEIGELYYKRWGIEKAFDVIKNKLNIENISGRKRLIIEQDFYAQMLVFNMAEDLRRDANSKLSAKEAKNLKYDYKVNMNILIGTFREYLIMIFVEKDDVKKTEMYKYMIE